MTAPDHRPYAGPTDLVTAADAARWLEEQAKAHRLKDSSGVVTRTCEQSTREGLRWDTT